MKRPTFSKIAIIVCLAIIGLQSYAQNYEPFTPRFDQDVKGDIVLIGNNILGPDNNAFNDNTVYNHNVNMQYIDIDSDTSTFCSSSADLEIPNPNCYRIIYAGLYWGAVNPGSEPITNVKFKGPVGDYVDIQGSIIYDANGTTVDGGDSFSYACFADVTNIVTNLSNDLGTYTVANVSSQEGQTSTYVPYNGTGQSAGWSLFIVFEDPTLPGKSITSFDGFSAISVPGNNPNLDIPVDGFRTIPAPAPVRANFAFATLEGDFSNGWSFTESLPNNTNDTLGEANVLTPTHDIDPSVGNNEEIAWEIIGTAPNRVLAVSFFEVPMFSGSCNNLLATHMAVFYETTNVIDIYIKDKPLCTNWNSGNAAVGIQNDAGTTAFVPPGRNTGQWTTTDEAWRFTPAGPSVIDFAWLDESNNVIGTTPTLNVCPVDPTTYTARVIYTNCNGDTGRLF